MFDSIYSLYLLLCCYKSRKYIDIDDSYRDINNYNFSQQVDRVRAVMILRSFTTIIVPFVTSMILLNQCGSYWSIFWNKCDKNEQSENFRKQLYSHDTDNDIFTVISPMDVCRQNNFFDDYDDDGYNYNYNHDYNYNGDGDLSMTRINKCQREFYDSWTPIIVSKLLCLTFHPFYLWIIAKYRSHPKIINIKNKQRSSEFLQSFIVRQIEELGIWTVDAEYAVLVTKLELSILFMTISPHVVVVCGLTLFVNKVVFRKLTNEYNYHITQWHFEKFPIGFLFISLIVQQSMITLFCWNEFEHDYVKYFMLTVFVVVDVAFIVCGHLKRFYRT